MKQVSTHDAKTHLSRLLAEVQSGEEIVVCRSGVPVARLVPFAAAASTRTRPRVGTVTSPPVKLSSDAFDPLSDEELAAWGL